MRHGEVHNPGRVLYGRLPGYNLSERGRQMAERMADHWAQHDITHLVCSPLERARQTIAPTAERLGLEPTIDHRVIEAANTLQGRVINSRRSDLFKPWVWWHLRNPLRPSWGESYQDIAARMRAAVVDAASAADGHEALIVTHQLPIWLARLSAEGRRLVHNPARRECTLASVTTLIFVDGRLAGTEYREPVADLLPPKDKKLLAGL
ncbi:histidine phosphatase family protein [Enemella sp. A6]|uniref:histidine phosphatase family protein n=1 Tax=Enemella sp. A6 TaxID=3440152 RepID=UPI003EBD19C4